MDESKEILEADALYWERQANVLFDENFDLLRRLEELEKQRDMWKALAENLMEVIRAAKKGNLEGYHKPQHPGDEGKRAASETGRRRSA